jgi:hypothetical protein
VARMAPRAGCDKIAVESAHAYRLNCIRLACDRLKERLVVFRRELQDGTICRSVYETCAR